MATIQIADKPTLDAVNLKVDNNIDNIKQVENNLDDVMNLLKGISTPYGSGKLGDVVYDESTFNWDSIMNGCYVFQTKSFTLPEGVTMTPPEKCGGLYIFSQGDVVINGTIATQGCLFTDIINVLPCDYIEIDGVQYPLAKGGDTVLGTAGGAAGLASTPTGYDNKRTASSNAGGTPTFVTLGSVMGGGISSYGTGATGGRVYNYYSHYDEDSYNSLDHGAAGVSTKGEGVCAVVIIAGGDIIIGDTGVINCDAVAGKPATSGTDGTYEEVTSYDNLGHQYDYYYRIAGNGGNGVLPPSGGGCITLVCNSLTNNGRLLCRGGKVITPTLSDGSDYGTYGSDKWYAGGGTQGVGSDTTIISSAGEIKIYETGGEA